MKYGSGVLLYLAVAASAFGQGAAAPAKSDVPAWLTPSKEINKILPSWMTFSGVYRARFEGYSGGGFATNATDDYLLSRLQLNLTIHPLPWLKIFGQGMDARALEKTPAVPTYQNTWDIRQAYIELGDVEKSMFAVRAGRQELIYGDGRLMGISEWSNTERSSDAIRGTTRYKGFRLDVFASSIIIPVTGQWDHHQQGNNLHGAYGGIDKLGPRFIAEPYALWRLQHGVKNEEGIVSKLNEKIGGLRIVGSQLPLAFDYGTEMVREFGSLGSDKIQTWAGHWVVGRTFASRWNPRVYAEYNYAGGDQNPKDGIRGTFDQLYPAGHDKLGFTDQVGWRNIKDTRAGLETKPVRNATFNLEYNNWFLASATDALYNSGGTAVFRSAAGTAGTHVGQEFDATGTWTLIPPVTFGAGIGHIFPGEFLKNTTKGNPYTYPYIMAIWRF